MAGLVRQEEEAKGGEVEPTRQLSGDIEGGVGAKEGLPHEHLYLPWPHHQSLGSMELSLLRSLATLRTLILLGRCLHLNP